MFLKSKGKAPGKAGDKCKPKLEIGQHLRRPGLCAPGEVSAWGTGQGEQREVGESRDLGRERSRDVRGGSRHCRTSKWGHQCSEVAKPLPGASGTSGILATPPPTSGLPAVAVATLSGEPH